jgi:hypothetical protein
MRIHRQFPLRWFNCAIKFAIATILARRAPNLPMALLSNYTVLQFAITLPLKQGTGVRRPLAQATHLQSTNADTAWKQFRAVSF